MQMDQPPIPPSNSNAPEEAIATEVLHQLAHLTPRPLRLHWLPWLWGIAALLALAGLWLARLSSL